MHTGVASRVGEQHSLLPAHTQGNAVKQEPCETASKILNSVTAEFKRRTGEYTYKKKKAFVLVTKIVFKNAGPLSLEGEKMNRMNAIKEEIENQAKQQVNSYTIEVSDPKWLPTPSTGSDRYDEDNACCISDCFSPTDLRGCNGPDINIDNEAALLCCGLALVVAACVCVPLFAYKAYIGVRNCAFDATQYCKRPDDEYDGPCFELVVKCRVPQPRL